MACFFIFLLFQAALFLFAVHRRSQFAVLLLTWCLPFMPAPALHSVARSCPLPSKKKNLLQFCGPLPHPKKKVYSTSITSPVVEYPNQEGGTDFNGWNCLDGPTIGPQRKNPHICIQALMDPPSQCLSPCCPISAPLPASHVPRSTLPTISSCLRGE